MKRFIAILSVFLMTLAAVARELPRALPDGPLSQSSILAFYDSLMTAPGTQLHGVMILQHGRVVGEMHPEPFGPQYRHTLYSCSKTLVGIGVMLAHEEGLLALDAPIVPVLRSALDSILQPEVPEGVERVRVCDLLEMSSGWTADWGLRSRSLHWLSDYLSRPLDFEPGSRFEYDSMVSYLLSAVVQAAVGRPLLDYLNEKLFVPLGIEAAWEQSPESVSCGGWGLYLHLESMAKIGQLLLQQGAYGGQRILSRQSVDALSACRRTDTWGDCYGGHVWCFKSHPGAYRADGAYGQFIIVVPEYDLVVALTQCTTGDLGRQLESVWQVLLHPGKDDKPLSAKAWSKRQQAYALPPAAGGKQLPARFLGQRWQLDSNPMGWTAVELRRKGCGLQLCVTDTCGVEAAFDLGHGRWRTTSTGLRPLSARPFYGQFSNIPAPFHVAGSYAVSDNQVQVKLLYVDWLTGVDLRFELLPEGKLRLHYLPNYEQSWSSVNNEYSHLKP